MTMRRYILAASLIVAQGNPVWGQQLTPTSGPAKAVPAQVPGLVARSTLGEIRGTALNSANDGLPKRPVRLRDTRNGRVSAKKLTDEAGLFSFRDVEPGNYVAELVTDREQVLAASQLLTVDAGSVVSTIVKLPTKVPDRGGLFGNNAAAAAIVAATAAAAGVLSVQVGDCVSPPCEN